MRRRSWCWDHSLSITLGVLGMISYGAGGYLAVATEWVRTSDFFLNLGHGFCPVALYGMLAGRLVERNRPDEDPA